MVLLLKNVERLEFSGKWLPDGTLMAFGNEGSIEEWPEEIEVCLKNPIEGLVKFRLEDSHSEIDQQDPDSSTAQAWYVPAE